MAVSDALLFIEDRTARIAFDQDEKQDEDRRQYEQGDSGKQNVATPFQIFSSVGYRATGYIDQGRGINVRKPYAARNGVELFDPDFDRQIERIKRVDTLVQRRQIGAVGSDDQLLDVELPADRRQLIEVVDRFIDCRGIRFSGKPYVTYHMIPHRLLHPFQFVYQFFGCFAATDDQCIEAPFTMVYIECGLCRNAQTHGINTRKLDDEQDEQIQIVVAAEWHHIIDQSNEKCQQGADENGLYGAEKLLKTRFEKGAVVISRQIKQYHHHQRKEYLSFDHPFAEQEIL